MRETRFVFEPLGKGHPRAAFSCGVEALDRYFRELAGQEVRRNLTAVYVLADREAGTIAGFYTLSATGIDAGAFPGDVTKRLPHYPRLPAILIGRLAVDQRYRGQGLGGGLLLDALARSFHQSRTIGALTVIVDAKDATARQFYQRYGFRSLVDDPGRLFITMTAIAQLALPVPPVR